MTRPRRLIVRGGLLLACFVCVNSPAERLAARQSLFTYAAPSAAPDIATHAERAREFVEHALDGNLSRALTLSGDSFRRDIGEKGLAHFRDYVGRQGPAQFIAQAVYDEDGYQVVAGVLALPNRRTMIVHVLFRRGQVEHLFERWGRR